MSEVYFFGCWGSPGHSMWAKHGRYVRDEALPAELQGGKLDGKGFYATPQEPYRYPPHQPLGVVRLQHITPASGGPVWTVISMWDRSCDTRYNCNASFLAVGVYSAEEMWKLAVRDFPQIVKRIKSQEGWPKEEQGGGEGAVPAPDSRREKLAALEHTQWAHWTRYMLGNLTPENIERWKRQLETPYELLSEKEKDSDREWADRVLALLVTKEA